MRKQNAAGANLFMEAQKYIRSEKLFSAGWYFLQQEFCRLTDLNVACFPWRTMLCLY
jgi:hypothetical protein